MDKKMLLTKLMDLENSIQILQDAMNTQNAKQILLEKQLDELKNTTTKTSSRKKTATKDE